MSKTTHAKEIANVIPSCNNSYCMLYRQRPIRWRGLNLSEKVAETLIDIFRFSGKDKSRFRDGIDSFRRNTYNMSAEHLKQIEKQYKTDPEHHYKPEHAIEYGLFWKQNKTTAFDFGCLGKILDHQVPLLDTDSRKNCGGEIDLVSTNQDIMYLLELKCKNNTESILRCVLEIYTYYCRIKDLSHFKSSFNLPSASHICISPLVFKNQYEDFLKAMERRKSLYDLISLIDDDLHRNGDYLSFSLIDNSASISRPWDMPTQIQTSTIRFSDL